VRVVILNGGGGAERCGTTIEWNEWRRRWMMALRLKDLPK
jgi:hypothetical protein